MKILYCCWNENSTGDVLESLNQIADEVICISKTVNEYISGSAISDIEKSITGDIDFVFSHDFFPIVSEICKVKKKTYVSVVYDWPNYTLFNPAIYNECNRIYHFDMEAINMLQKYRVNNIFYMPLSVNEQRLDQLLGSDITKTRFEYDVSFVGNLYLKKEEALFTKDIPMYYSGFVDALVNAQQKIYGYNLINEIVDKTFVNRYSEAIKNPINGMNVPEEFILATQINKYVTGCERKNILNTIAKKHKVHLFTQSVAEGLENVIVCGGVDYMGEMPKVFRKSKINLNITLRSITTGVPLRVFDILGAGGFCLTNYQMCIAEHFEDGKDLVMYSSVEDMMEKIDYYLTHEEERMAIAQNGHRKVKEYSYKNIYRKIFVE